MATFLALSVRYERFLLALFSYYLAGCGAALELPPCPSSEAEGYGVLRDPGVPICRMSTLHRAARWIRRGPCVYVHTHVAAAVCGEEVRCVLLFESGV